MTVVNLPMYDTYIDPTYTEYNYGASAGLWAELGWKILMRCQDLSGVPVGAIVNSASLHFYSPNGSDGTEIGLHRSKVIWYEGDGNGGDPSGDGSTYNHRNYNGEVVWAGGVGGLAGTEYEAVASVVAQYVNGWNTIDVAADMRLFLAGANLGWWFVAISTATLDITAHEEAGAYDPYVELNYSIGGASRRPRYIRL